MLLHMLEGKHLQVTELLVKLTHQGVLPFI